ncbi:Proteasome assembly chaperone 2 [Geodia barretti]|uniref:Proteasome assembly chaperone 2 n=1 Tax=Geodia barretti TaxID=519541 RepID=A0AA35RYN5_GEOBA|nr:Proteasome assembly chaperone 2 [Geodia barretti]
MLRVTVMFTPSHTAEDQSVSFAGSRLILPCISVGNVGQLAVDLLINTLRLPRAGHLHHPSLLPLAGSGAYSHTSGLLHTAAEVYHSSELKITVVQMRTPVAKGRSREFCDAFLQWVQSSSFSDTVLLTSSHAHERIDSQIQGTPLRYVLSPSVSSSLHSHLSEDLDWSSLEPRSSSSSNTAPTTSQETDGTPGVLDKSQLFFPGSGLAKKLYLKWSSEGVPMVVLVLFSYQGDNVKEALQLATSLDSWLHLRDSSSILKDKKAWHPPPSWDLMYGGPSPHSLF